jgi:hypothetical protein
MMKKTFFMALVCGISLLFSCGDGDSAEKVNKVITDRVDKTVRLLENAGNYILADNYNVAQACLDSISMYVSTASLTIGRLNSRSGESFKQSALNLLTMIAADGVPTYTRAIEIYRSATDNAQMDVANKLINDFIDRLADHQDTLLDDQRKFVEKHRISWE